MACFPGRGIWHAWPSLPFPLLAIGTLVTRTLPAPAQEKTPAGLLPAGVACHRSPTMLPGEHSTPRGLPGRLPSLPTLLALPLPVP
jgi:hypothetical protein